MSDVHTEFVRDSREQLARAGLERVTLGESVYWRSANVGAGFSPPTAGGLKPAPTEGNVVLVHGVNDQAGTWSPIVEGLSQFNVIIPDLAGHGESGPAAGPLPMPLMLERLHAILEAENVAKATFVGSSMGGWVSMLYAVAHPDVVERLVLEDASGMMWPIAPALLAPRDREQVAAMMRAVNGPADATPDALLDEYLVRAPTMPMPRVVAGGILAHAIDPHLAKLTMPAALIWGEHDGLLPVAYAETLRGRLANAKLQVIEDAAHIPHRQQPRRFLACLLETFSPNGHA